jgi:uncharacterized membrane protein
MLPATQALKSAPPASSAQRRVSAQPATRSALAARIRIPWLILALALIGIGIASYVAQASYLGRLLWAPLPLFDGSNIVAQSPYARVAGIPLSFLGVMYYVHLFGLAAFLAYDPRSRGLRGAALAYTGAGVGYSLFSLYIQGAWIGAFCIYCMVSALLTVLLLATAIWHYRATRTPTPAIHT